MRSSPRAESSSSSSSESSIHEHMRPKHILKPPKYDGAGSFETFLAQFQNCASYRRGIGSPKGVRNRQQWAREGPVAR